MKVNVPLTLAKYHSDIKFKLVLENHYAICNQVLYFVQSQRSMEESPTACFVRFLFSFLFLNDVSSMTKTFLFKGTFMFADSFQMVFMDFRSYELLYGPE